MKRALLAVAVAAFALGGPAQSAFARCDNETPQLQCTINCTLGRLAGAYC